ncbi:MAG TPA: prolyl oligopeptidase family serine peptidase [Bryobacteraceae bacterium]|nr:prolyl oligopeptidase family serine peptidase [Bryobacteraceae bacterium]
MQPALTRGLWPRSFALVFCALAASFVALPQSTPKHAITLADMDHWRTIQNTRISEDGKFLAYGLFPQEGNGEVVVRDLATGKEFRAPAGERPQPEPPEDDPSARPVPRPIRISFSADRKYVVASTFATSAERKRDRTSAKDGIAIIDLSTGKVIQVARVKKFQVPELSGSYLVYLKEAATGPATSETANSTPANNGAQQGAQANHPPPAPINTPQEQTPARTGRADQYGSDLVIRQLASGTERTIPNVTDFEVTKDGEVIAYTVRARTNPDSNGVYLVNPASQTLQPKSVLVGKGKYSRPAWDESQKQLAFLSERDDKTTRLHLTSRLGTNTQDFGPTGPWPEGHAINDRAALTFSKDGKRIFFSTAPKPPENRAAPNNNERVVVDLWHWKDDRIQAMQKVQAQADRNRTYRAVLHIDQKRFVQLADSKVQTITLSDDGLWAIGADERTWRAVQEYDQRYRDSYLVNTETGERKLLARKHLGDVAWSPNGRYATLFNGHDWLVLNVADGTTVNVTEKLKVAFYDEDNDRAGAPGSYGSAGWTKDGQYVLFYDRFDIWRMKPDGSEAVNLTANYGRQNGLQLRYVRLSTRPEDRWIDPSKPLLLRAEHLENRDTGFFRAKLNAAAAPEKLLLAPRDFEGVMKAKDAETYVLTAQTFQESPDLHVTDSNFRELRKVSDANPQQAELFWGTAELIRYRNVDGVPLSGVLYKPENFDPSKKYPMIVYLYERLSQTFHQFREPRPTNSINIPQYTSNGYVVLLPDIIYRIGSPGSSALKCVLPAVQEAVDRGFIDEKNIGIQGHSWGGYQIAYMLTETNRFKAAAPGAVVANMTSAYNGIRYGPGLPRQFQYERDQSRIGGSLWEYPIRFIENSPIFKADRIQTPILMIHNDADDAVPYTQGIEFYLALRRLGKEVYMFNYNGEPHNLRKRPNQKDYTTRLFEYFNYYLKGAPKPSWMERGIPYLERDLPAKDVLQPSGAADVKQ